MSIDSGQIMTAGTLSSKSGGASPECPAIPIPYIKTHQAARPVVKVLHCAH